MCRVICNKTTQIQFCQKCGAAQSNYETQDDKKRLADFQKVYKDFGLYRVHFLFSYEKISSGYLTFLLRTIHK